IKADSSLPVTIVTDEQRLEQILRNLLSNAFKFTEAGEVTLSIKRAAEERISFAVSDTGVGIASDKLRVIFEAFQQADGTTSRKYGGTGLGLSISRELAKALGGEIHVESRLEQGTTFTLTMPITFAGAFNLDSGEDGGAGASRGSPATIESAGSGAGEAKPTPAGAEARAATRRSGAGEGERSPAAVFAP